MGIMTATTTYPELLGSRLKTLPAMVVSLALALLLGFGTSYAQGFLPDAVSSFANSASGWTILTWLIVWAIRSRTGLSALLGAIGFVGLVLGYTLASELRGLSYNPVFFGVVGVVVGPFVGVAASWLRRREWRAAAGVGLLSGIAVGEALYGLTAVSETTSPVYWILVGVLGLVLLVCIVVRQIGRPRIMVAAVALTAAVAAAFAYSYTALGSA